MKHIILALSITCIFSCEGQTVKGHGSTQSVTSQNKNNNTSKKSDEFYKIIEEVIDESEFNKVNYFYDINKEKENISKIKKLKSELDLILKKDTLFFVDNDGVPYDENKTSYKFINDLKDIQKYLVELKNYEETLYLLIDKNTAEIDTLQGIPLFSPKKKFILVENYNQHETNSDIPPPTEDIYIYYLDDDKLNKIYFQSFPQQKLEQIKWKNDSLVYLKFSNNQNFKALKIVQQIASKKSNEWEGIYNVKIFNKENIIYNFEIKIINSNNVELLIIEGGNQNKYNGKYKEIQKGKIGIYYANDKVLYIEKLENSEYVISGEQIYFINPGSDEFKINKLK
jgi:hypothetical protein